MTASTKSVLRARLLALRDAVPASDRKAASDKIAVHALDYCAALSPEPGSHLRVAAYCSFNSEVETSRLLAQLLRGGAQLYLPRVVPSGGASAAHPQLELRQVPNLERDFSPGALGISEPNPATCPLLSDAEGPRSSLDVIFVPGCGFDAAGNRLGYGKGFYDRLLAEMPGGAKTKKVGLAFTFQLAQAVPAEAHDVPMDAIITENGIQEPASP